MSSSREETINNVKNSINNTFNNLANSENGRKVLSRSAKDRERLTRFFNENKLAVILGTILVVILAIYFIVFYNRIPRYLDRMDKYYKEYINIQPVQYNKKVMNGDFKLCDFYIAASYKSYLPCTNYYDYSSIDAVKKCILYGARYIDLDVMNNDFSDCSEPVICAGDEVGNWHYTTSIDFDKTIKAVAKYAFSGMVKNGSDPFFININLKTWYNKKTINKCASVLKIHVVNFYLKNTLGGRYTSTNCYDTHQKINK